MSIIQEILQKIHVKLKNRFIWLDFIFLLVVSLYIISGITLVPFHGDESAYIVISQDYDRIKQQGFEHILFNPEGDSKQYIRLTTGSILAYSIGFARDITDNDDPVNKWLWGSSWEDNVALGNMPTPRLLTLARTCSVLMGALSIVFLFLTAVQLFSSRVIAWTATLTLATHGDVLINIRRAMQEGPKFLFLILTIYLASHILKNLQKTKINRYWYVFLGIASGLTLATKQDTVPMLIAIYFALAFIPIWRKDIARNIFINIFYLGTATILAYAVFLILMPVFWRWWENAFLLISFVIVLYQLPVWQNNQSAKLLAALGFIVITTVSIRSPEQLGEFLKPVTLMLETREGAVAGQLTLNSISLNTINNKIYFFLQTTFTSQVMYMEVDSFDVQPFHEQIVAYEKSFLSGRINQPIFDMIFLLLAIVGGWQLLKYFNEQSLFIYSLFFITGILLLVMIPLPWQRYFLIMQIPYALILGVGFNHVWSLRKSYLNNKM